MGSTSQVMDWGLAKLLPEQAETTRAEDDDLERTDAYVTVIDTPEAAESKTKTGQMLGTPAYMPPEQAGGLIRLLDPRSDVFGLGAVLCEILTGQPPYQARTANEVRLQAVRGELADALTRLEHCDAEPELTALCKRCLAFRQEDRPPDGEAVAAEVARIRQAAEDRARQAELERERALVRIEEQRKRRRVVQIAGGLVAAVLVAGLAVSTWQRLRANRERDDKARALESEAAAKQEAVRRLAQIEKGVELFAGMLTGIDPRAKEIGSQPLYDQLRQRAEKAADQLLTAAVADPVAEARLQTIMGNTLRGLGSYARAVEVLRRARATREQELGAEHADTLDTLNDLALAYEDAGKLPEAIALFQQVRAARVKKSGANHPDTLATLYNLAGAYHAAGKLPEAIALYQQVLVVREKKLGPGHPDTLVTLNGLALAYQATGKMPEAITLFQRVRAEEQKKRGPDHPDTLITLNNLGLAYSGAGKLPEAIRLFERARNGQVKKLGADHPTTLITLNNLAGAYLKVGKLPEAIALFRWVRDARVRKLGPDHRHTLSTQNNLALAYQSAGNLPEAIALLEQVRAACVKNLGAGHPDTLTTLNNLARAYQAAGKLPEALPLFEQAAAEVQKRRFRHQYADRIITGTIAGYEAAKGWDEAERWRRAWMAQVKENSGAESPAYANQLTQLGRNLLRQHRWTDAESLLRESLKLRQKQAPAPWATFNTMSLLGGALAGRNKYAEAEPLLLKGYHGMKALVKRGPLQRKARLPEAAGRLVELYRAMRKDDEARKWQQTLTNIVGKLQEPIHDVGKGLTLKNQLDARALTLAYQVRLQAGTQYVVAMSSAEGKALTPSLALTDEENNVLAEAGNRGGKPGARISYRALRTAVYRIRATSANDGKGAFTLTVGEKKEEK